MSDDVEGGVEGGADTGTAPPWDSSGESGAPGEPVEAELVGPGWDEDDDVDVDPERTDGGAVAALVLAIASYVLLPLIGSVVALFLAAGAEQRISVSGGALGGSGMVTAAKILSWVHLALLAVAAVVVLLVLLVRSADDVPLELDSAEQVMTESIQAQYPGVSVERATCPDDVAVEAGGQFTCTTVIDGQELEILVTQDDDEGNVSFLVSDVVVQVGDVQDFIVEEYRKQGTRVAAFCAEEDQQVLVQEIDSTIECIVQIPDGGGTTAVVTVKADGGLAIDFGTQAAEEPAQG